MFKPKEVIGLGVMAGVFYALLSRDLVALWTRSREDAGDLAAAIDPASDQNIFFKWSTDIYQKITGSKQTPGADLYDLLNPKADNPADPVDAPAGDPPEDEYIDSWRHHQEENGFYG